VAQRCEGRSGVFAGWSGKNRGRRGERRRERMRKRMRWRKRNRARTRMRARMRERQAKSICNPQKDRSLVSAPRICPYLAPPCRLARQVSRPAEANQRQASRPPRRFLDRSRSLLAWRLRLGLAAKQARVYGLDLADQLAPAWFAGSWLVGRPLRLH